MRSAELPLQDRDLCDWFGFGHVVAHHLYPFELRDLMAMSITADEL
jgi:hypothetical protein